MYNYARGILKNILESYNREKDYIIWKNCKDKKEILNVYKKYMKKDIA